MSKYWNNLNILRKHRKDSKGLFLSTDRPSVLHLEHGEIHEIKDENDRELLKEISDFYCSSFRVGKNNNTNQVSVEDLLRFLHLDCEFLIMKNENKVAGSIVSIYVPIYISGFDSEYEESEIRLSENFENMKTKNALMCACASFLILHERYRGKGYGMRLIQESLQKFYDNGGLMAFFVNTISRCDNSIGFNTWYFPLNFEKLDICKYPYPKDYKKYFAEKLEIFKNLKDNVVQVDENNSELAYNFYFSQIKESKFYFSPSYSYWKKWIESFPTFLCYQENSISGIFCFNSQGVKYSHSNKELLVGLNLFCIGKQPETLISSVSKAKEMFDIVNFFELGQLNKKLFVSILAQRAQKRYINFYNTTLKLKAEDFYCPIF